MAQKQINSTCLCGACQFSFNVDYQELPLKAHLCHCDVSRRISGTICTSYVSAPEFSSLVPEQLQKTMTAYHSSDAYNRWFCTSCGTHMVFEHISTGSIHLATGTIEADDLDNIIDFKGHMYLQYSKDGGASDFIRTLDGKPTERWLVEPGKSEQVPTGWRGKDSDIAAEAAMDAVPLHCHCRRTQLRITRPTEASQSVSPALEAPHQLYPIWWLSEDRKRFLASTCLCRSCRLGAGFDLMSWSFIPLVNIEFADGSAINGAEDGLEADERIRKTLTVYHSKTRAGVKRYFCPTCGACVFWFTPNRPKLLDVASGLLDAPSGVRAETFLEWWTAHVDSSEEAQHQGLLKGLQTGLKEWKAEQGTK